MYIYIYNTPWPLTSHACFIDIRFDLEEMSFHVIDLEKWEQRRCFHTLVRLAAAEDSVTLDLEKPVDL